MDECLHVQRKLIKEHTIVGLVWVGAEVPVNKPAVRACLFFFNRARGTNCSRALSLVTRSHAHKLTEVPSALQISCSFERHFLYC